VISGLVCIRLVPTVKFLTWSCTLQIAFSSPAVTGQSGVEEQSAMMLARRGSALVLLSSGHDTDRPRTMDHAGRYDTGITIADNLLPRCIVLPLLGPIHDAFAIETWLVGEVGGGALGNGAAPEVDRVSHSPQNTHPLYQGGNDTQLTHFIPSRTRRTGGKFFKFNERMLYWLGRWVCLLTWAPFYGRITSYGRLGGSLASCVYTR
jgi:hypothetical protein